MLKFDEMPDDFAFEVPRLSRPCRIVYSAGWVYHSFVAINLFVIAVTFIVRSSPLKAILGVKSILVMCIGFSKHQNSVSNW